jgi:hypothetical protein
MAGSVAPALSLSPRSGREPIFRRSAAPGAVRRLEGRTTRRPSSGIHANRNDVYVENGTADGENRSVLLGSPDPRSHWPGRTGYSHERSRFSANYAGASVASAACPAGRFERPRRVEDRAGALDGLEVIGVREAHECTGAGGSRVGCGEGPVRACRRRDGGLGREGRRGVSRAERPGAGGTPAVARVVARSGACGEPEEPEAVGAVRRALRLHHREGATRCPCRRRQDGARRQERQERSHRETDQTSGGLAFHPTPRGGRRGPPFRADPGLQSVWLCQVNRIEVRSMLPPAPGPFKRAGHALCRTNCSVRAS